jgi:hypothetical protein
MGKVPGATESAAAGSETAPEAAHAEETTAG